CTDRKRTNPLPHHRLGAHPSGALRATRWLTALRDGRGDAMAAGDLYIGNHWAIVRKLPDLAGAAGWSRVKLWVASAGYGLLDVGTKVVAYSATFGVGHLDSVADAASGQPPLEQARRWWQALAAARAADGAITCMNALVR